MKIKYEIVEKNILKFLKKYIEFKLNEIDEKFHELIINMNELYDDMKIYF